MKSLLLIVTSLLLLELASCKEKNRSIYEECCGAEVTVDSFRFVDPVYDPQGNLLDSTRAGSIFIPNAFVPYNSSIISLNNKFQIGVGLGTSMVISTVYTSENGDTLFQKENFSPFNPLEEGWNREKPNGDIYYGLFNYRIEIELIDGQIRTYIGKACAFKCEDDGFPLENLPNCFFPSQSNGNGGFNQSLPGSAECF